MTTTKTTTKTPAAKTAAPVEVLTVEQARRNLRKAERELRQYVASGETGGYVRLNIRVSKAKKALAAAVEAANPGVTVTPAKRRRVTATTAKTTSRRRATVNA